MRVLVLLVLLLAPTAQALGAADVTDVRPLWQMQWQDAQGGMHTGVTGAGVAVWSGEPYDATHPDLAPCSDGEHRALVVGSGGENIAGPVPLGQGTDAHGDFIAGVLCGSGEASDGRYAGVAPGLTVFAFDGYCIGGCGLADWFEEPGLRIYTWSTGSDQYEAMYRHGRPEDKDLLFVAAAGNDGGDGTESQTAAFLADHEEVMGVAAADGDLDDVAFYSSRGARDDPATWPKITAPGCMIGVVPPPWADYHVTGANQYLNQLLGDEACPEVTPQEFAEATAAGYSLSAGTSYAAPIVAAVAGMMAEVAPGLSSGELRFLLTQTADPFMPTNDTDGDGRVSPDEFHAQHGFEAGYGLVNATAAVAAAHRAALHPDQGLDVAVACATVAGGVLNPTDPCAPESGGPAPVDPEPTTPEPTAVDDASGPEKRSPALPVVAALVAVLLARRWSA